MRKKLATLLAISSFLPILAVALSIYLDSNINILSYKNIAIFVISTTISLLIVFKFTDYMFSPIQKLVDFIRSTPQINITPSEDDLETLSSTINNTVEKLSTTNSFLEQKVLQLSLEDEVLKKALEFQKTLLENSATAIMLMSSKRIILEVNKETCKMLGYTEGELVGQSAEIIHINKEAFLKWGPKFEAVKKGKEISNAEYFFKRKDGVVIWCAIYGSSVELDNGEYGVIWSILDISKRKQIENELQKSYKELENINNSLEHKVEERTSELQKLNDSLRSSEDTIKAILNIQDNLVIVTDGKKIIHANSAFLNYFQCKDIKEIQGEECFCIWLLFEPPLVHDDEPCGKWLDRIERHGWRVNIRNKETGILKNFIVVAKPFTQKEGLFVVTFTDITILQEERDYFVHLAATDALTGLHNRAKLNETLEYSIQKAKRYSQPFCVIIFDADLFKQVNDTHGHQVGDSVLQKIAAITKENVRSSDFIARYGGEEFVILAPSTPLEHAKIMAEKLRYTIENSAIEGLNITCSFGIAELMPDDTPEELIKRADGLLYKAKQSGRNQVQA